MDYIKTGHLDSHLDTIQKAVRERQRRVGYRTLDELHVGQEVRIKGIGTGAKYLNGAIGIVTDVKRTRVLVRLTRVGSNGYRGSQRFTAGTQVYFHGQNLEPTFIEGESSEPLEKVAPRDIFLDNAEDIWEGVKQLEGVRNVTPK